MFLAFDARWIAAAAAGREGGTNVEQLVCAEMSLITDADACS